MYTPDGWNVEESGQATACVAINGKAFRTQWYSGDIISRAKQSCGDEGSLFQEIPRYLPAGAMTHWYTTYGRSYYVVPNSLIISSGIPRRFLGNILDRHKELVSELFFVPEGVTEYNTAREAALSLTRVLESLSLTDPE